jgi:hypothetical protein
LKFVAIGAAGARGVSGMMTSAAWAPEANKAKTPDAIMEILAPNIILLNI